MEKRLQFFDEVCRRYSAYSTFNDYGSELICTTRYIFCLTTLCTTLVSAGVAHVRCPGDVAYRNFSLNFAFLHHKHTEIQRKRGRMGPDRVKGNE